MKCILVLALVTLGTAWAQRPCAAPFQLTFRAFQWEYDGKFFTRYFGQYDRQNMRTVFFEETENATAKEVREFLFLHNEHRGFDLDLKSKQCKMFSIGPFRPWEVPHNATYRGEASIGGPQEVVTVDQWDDKTTHERETWVGDFTLLNCFPVNQFLLEAKDFNKTILTAYYDMLSGIVNPDDFQVPKECQQALQMRQFSEMPFQARAALSTVSGSLH